MMKKLLLLFVTCLLSVCTEVHANYKLPINKSTFTQINSNTFVSKETLFKSRNVYAECKQKIAETNNDFRIETDIRHKSSVSAKLESFSIIESTYNDKSTEEEQIDPFYTTSLVTFTPCDEVVTNIFTEEEIHCNYLIENLWGGYGPAVYAYYDAVNDTIHIPGQITYTHQSYGSFATASMLVNTEGKSELFPYITYDVHEDAKTHLLSLSTHQIQGYEETVNVLYIVDGGYAGQLWQVMRDDKYSYHQSNYTMHFQTRMVDAEGAWEPWSEEKTIPVFVEDSGDSFLVHNWYSDFYNGAINTVLTVNKTGTGTFEVPFCQPVVYYQDIMVSLANYRGEKPTDSAPGFIDSNGNYLFGQMTTDNIKGESQYDPMVVFITPDNGSRWYGVIDGFIYLTPNFEPQSYTLCINGAPEGTCVVYNNITYRNGDVITIAGLPDESLFTLDTIDNCKATIEVDTENFIITVSYIEDYSEHMAELLIQAQAEYDSNSSYVEGDNIIQTVNQLSSPFTESREGKIDYLIDGKTSTYWHSDWTTTKPNHSHYIQVDALEPISGTIKVTMSRREDTWWDHCTKMGVWACNEENDEYVEVGQLEFPYNIPGETLTRTFNIPVAYRYFRFWNDASNDNIDRGYFHMSEFQLCVMGLNPSCPNAKKSGVARALAQAIAEASVIVYPNKADIDALQNALEAYRIGIGLPEFTVSIVGAPEGTTITYKDVSYSDGDVITIEGYPSVGDFEIPVIPHYTSNIAIDNANYTITLTYTRDTICSGKAEEVITQAYEGYFAIAGMAQNGVTTKFLYDNGGQVLAKSFVESEQDMYWHAESVGDEMYTFKNVGTGKYLNIATTNNQPITTSDNPQNLYFVISNSVACIHNGSIAIDVAFEGTRPISWSGTIPEGSRRLLIYEAIMADPDATYTYTVRMPNAPEGAKITYRGVDYKDGDNIIASSLISSTDIVVAKVENYSVSFQIVGRTIEVIYVYNPTYILAQSGTPTQVRYWFDTDGKVHTSDYAASAINIDASSLDMGIHALYYQVVDNKGQLSPVRFANFYRLPAERAEDLGLSGTPTQVRYWFDTDGEVHTSAYTAGTINIDAASLDMGIHALYYQVVDDKGQLSPARFANFYRLPAEEAQELGLSGKPTHVRYWFDTDGEVHTSDYEAGTISIDASALDMGIHALYYQVVDDKGQMSPARFANFYRLPAEGAEDLGLSGNPAQVRYWADADHEHMQQTAYVAGHTIINLSMYGEGEPGEQHTLHYQVLDDKGNISPVRSISYIYDKHQQVIVLEEWEVLKRFHDASVQQGEWTRNAWSMEDGRGETADESLERLPGVSLVDGHVRSIDLSQSGVTGDVLSLAELPELEHLNLSGNAIANVELPLISETATANLRNQTITDKKDIVWDAPTEQSLTENIPNIMRLSADARSLAEQYTWTLWNAPTATGWRMSLVMQNAMPELRQVSSRIYDNANGGDATLQVAAGIAAGTTLPVQFHYLDGDANLSGAVDVLDVQMVVNESFGIGNGLLNKQAADLQADGSLNVLDLVRVVNVLLAQEMPSQSASTRHMEKVSTQHVGKVSLECIDGGLLMESTEHVSALDLWLCLPQGNTENDIQNLLTSFDMATRQSGNLCHIVLYSPMGMEMDGMGEALLSVPQGTTLLKASAANAEANSLSVSIGQATNITEVTATQKAGSTYDLQGRISNARGLHISKQRGIYTKSLTK